MKQVKKFDYWMFVEIGLWVMAGLWAFLGVCGFVTLSAEETMSCVSWFLRLVVAATVVNLAREGIF